MPLPIADWQDTYQARHLWTQIIGKIRVEHPKTTTGGIQRCHPLWTDDSAIPDGTRTFQITFDFLHHQLLLETSDGIIRTGVGGLAFAYIF